MSESADIRLRLHELEQKVELLYQHLGIAVPVIAPGSGVSPEVQVMAQSGNAIGAIKLHREQTGLGLLEAKADIDALMGNT